MTKARSEPWASRRDSPRSDEAPVEPVLPRKSGRNATAAKVAAASRIREKVRMPDQPGVTKWTAVYVANETKALWRRSLVSRRRLTGYLSGIYSTAVVHVSWTSALQVVRGSTGDEDSHLHGLPRDDAARPARARGDVAVFAERVRERGLQEPRFRVARRGGSRGGA